MTVAVRPELALVDGEPCASCALEDRGLMYGDGVFRTLRMIGGQPVWLDAQLDKLESDCQCLGIRFPDRNAWQLDLEKLALQMSAHQMPDAAVKLVVTRGVGLRGYRPSPAAVPTRIVMAGPLPAYSEEIEEHGVQARLCTLRLGLQPRLAGVKHLNRLENVLARMEWSDPSISEGVLCDSDGRVVSGVSSNLFIVQHENLITPKLDRCGVAGVTRHRIMQSANSLGLKSIERDLHLQDVWDADALFFSNSLIKLWWVNRLGDKTWPHRPASYLALRGLLDD